MSGCCGQGPVIVAGTPATPRVEVETVLLCDVAADGTVAATVLVEPVYDTSSGARIGTRTVDPATGDPYTPVGTLRPCSPEGCTATTSAQVLCDLQADGTASAFIRATTYDCDGALLATLDRTLDGAAYTVTGTVGVCPAVPDCDSPTTPVTSVGLCLADGTPIAATVVRDCAGVVTGEGWVNLVTGAYSAGAPPAGTIACGDSRSITTNGTFCDVLADGTVAGLVLVEYQYAADGSIDTVRLVDAVTGTTYTPQGTVTTCPAGVEQPEQDAVQLCDVAADGTVTTMIRDYRRDELGAIVGHTDYTLDGTPYTPQGTIGVCPPPCRSTHAEVLCDSAPRTLALTTAYRPLSDAPIDTVANEIDAGPATGDALWSGQTATVGPTSGVHDLTYVVGALGVGCPGCGQPDDEVAVTVSVGVTLNGPSAGAGSTGGLQMLNGTASLGAAVLPTDTQVGWSGTLTLTRTVPLADLRDGQLKVRLGLETSQDGPKDWTLTGWTATAERTAAGCGSEFLRTYVRDCVTGEVTDTLDTTLDGAPYVPVEPVGTCRDDDPCTPPGADCQTEQLCDVQKDVAAVLPSVGVPTEAWQDLANGTRWMRRGNDGAAPGGWYGADSTSPERFDFDRPVLITYSVRFSSPTAAPLRIPAGWYLDVINTGQHAWNPATRTLSPTASATQAGQSTFRIEAQTAQTMIAPSVVGTQTSGQTSQYGQITVTADQATLFLRTLCRDSAGTVTTTDTLLDGTTPYTVLGTPGRCPQTTPPPCRDCETLVLCDGGGNDAARITGTGASTGTLSNGVTWISRGTAAPVSATYDGGAGEGSWWPAIYSFPNPTIADATWSFDKPSYVEFSVYMRWFAFSGGDASNPNPRNATRLPADVEVVSLPDGYSYDPVNHLVWVDESRSGAEPCSNLTAPTIAESARFRTLEPVSSVTTRYLGVRVANCGVFGSQRVGAFDVEPTGQFLRTICRDCDGTISSVRDTELDGTTPYTPSGAVGVCQPPPTPEPESCCQPVQVCIQQDTTQVVEFISNEDHRNDNTVDPVWKWTTDLNAVNPPWYDMYQRQYSAAWSVVDSDTERPAWWVSPHPNGASAQSSPALPNEGPSLLNAHWYPRAFFDLPDNADPATIQVQATVFNADQIGRAFRLNDGAWQTLPATATHNGTTYTFGPDTIPGAQAGRNYLYLDVEETVGGGAGLMVHLRVLYEVIPETRSWTRMVCCDGSVYYLDEDGVRQDAVPDGWHVAPCFLPPSASAPAPVETEAPVQTGIRRVVGTAVQAMKTEFAGLQSVSLSVLAGTVNVTMTSGAAQAVPAGATLTWSVSDTDDTSLALATFAGTAAGADYLLNWTYKAGAAG